MEFSSLHVQTEHHEVSTADLGAWSLQTKHVAGLSEAAERIWCLVGLLLSPELPEMQGELYALSSTAWPAPCYKLSTRLSLSSLDSGDVITIFINFLMIQE